MENQEYANLMRKYRMLKNGCASSKVNIPENIVICYKDKKYLPYKYEIDVNEKTGALIHNAILRDFNCHSVIHVSISDIDLWINRIEPEIKAESIEKVSNEQLH